MGNKITKIKEILDLNFLNNKMAKEEKIKHYDSVLKDIEENYISKYYDTSYLVKYSEEIIEIENLLLFHLSIRIRLPSAHMN